MSQDNTLKQHVDARAKYREDVVGQKFTSFAKHVQPSVSDPQPILDRVKGDSNAVRQAAAQQAVDLIQATNRAVDMRNMTHADYRAAYASSAPFVDNYEQSRAERYQNGQI